MGVMVLISVVLVVVVVSCCPVLHGITDSLNSFNDSFVIDFFKKYTGSGSKNRCPTHTCKVTLEAYLSQSAEKTGSIRRRKISIQISLHLINSQQHG